MKAASLINQAVNLCHMRKDMLSNTGEAQEERGALDVHIINASRMQLDAGVPSTLDHDVILHMSRRGLKTEYEPSARAMLIVARIAALVSLARTRHEVFLLLEADEVLESELSKDYIGSSPYVIDLLLAKAEVTIAWADLLPDDRAHLLLKAWKLYRQATTHNAGSVIGRARVRYQGCLKWASYALTRASIMDAFEAYSQALGLLPELVFFGEDIIGRIEILRQVDGLAASSAVTALSLGRVSAAIQCLEQTRGILWLQLLQTRSPELDFIPFHLREQFDQVCRELEATDSLTWTARRHAAEKLAKIVLGIRSLPGFERFLMPPQYEDIGRLLEDRNAYAVLIIPSHSHCDVVALGVPRDRAHLRIFTFNADRIRYLTNSLISVTATARAAHSSMSRSFKKMNIGTVPENKFDVHELLSELWESLIQPILSHMNLLVH
jgi:hypothetical protein